MVGNNPAGIYSNVLFPTYKPPLTENFDPCSMEHLVLSRISKLENWTVKPSSITTFNVTFQTALQHERFLPPVSLRAAKSRILGVVCCLTFPLTVEVVHGLTCSCQPKAMTATFSKYKGNQRASE